MAAWLPLVSVGSAANRSAALAILARVVQATEAGQGPGRGPRGHSPRPLAQFSFI
jgi:hypothetical protein